MTTLRIGSKGANVARWQAIIGVPADGAFGPITDRATRMWQSMHGLVADGIVGFKTWAAAGVTELAPKPLASPIPFMKAKFYGASRMLPANLIVIHTAECSEHPGADVAVARYFTDPRDSKGRPVTASAHYTIDSDSVTQSVWEHDVAWHAGPVNGRSIGVEHAGTAFQTPAQWADAYSTAMLARSAKFTAELAWRYGIPVTKLTPEEVRAGAAGFCGHVDVTKGFGIAGGHVDPGKAFDWQAYLEAVGIALADLKANPPRLPSNDDELTWTRVTSADGEWLVGPTPIYPVAIGEAARIARERGWDLPTPALVDAIWRAADLRVEPITMSPNKGSDAAQLASHARRVEAAIAPRLAMMPGRTCRLLAGTHKDVAIKDGRVGLYGWHRADGQPIQTFYAGHELAWKDYSHGLRPCKRGGIA